MSSNSDHRVADACRDHDRWNLALQAIDTGLDSATNTAQHISEEALLAFYNSLYVTDSDSIVHGRQLTRTIMEWCFKAGDLLQGACTYSYAACELYEDIRTFVSSIIANNNLITANAIAITGLINDHNHNYSFSGWILRAQLIRVDINRQYMFTLTSAAAASQRYTYLLNLVAGVHMSDDSEQSSD